MNLGTFFHIKNCSLSDIAEHLGLPVETVSDWCNGIGMPDGKQAVQISEFIGCEMKELYMAILNTSSPNS